MFSTHGVVSIQRKSTMVCAQNLWLGTRGQFRPSLVVACGESIAFAMKQPTCQCRTLQVSRNQTKLLVTAGCTGWCAHHCFVHCCFVNPDWSVVSNSASALPMVHRIFPKRVGLTHSRNCTATVIHKQGFGARLRWSGRDVRQ